MTKKKTTKAEQKEIELKKKQEEAAHKLELMRIEMEQIHNNITIASSLTDELNYGLDIINKIIYLSGEIDQYSGVVFQQKLMAILKFHGIKDQDPITLNISSYGGDVYSTFSIIDSIRNCPIPINTAGSGQIMSAAALILSAGTGKRSLTPNSYIMNHEISTMFSGQASSIQNEASHVKILQEQFVGLLDKFTKKRKGYWGKKLKHNVYINAEDSKKLKLIDNIVGV
jgi:ATP-dependent Clp protease, protease subunit